MPEEFHHLEVSITCPQCGHERKAPIGRLTPNGSLPCFHCGGDIFMPREEWTTLHRRLRRLKRSLADPRPSSG